jgi:predicted alpha/beta superfamily hydrolase
MFNAPSFAGLLDMDQPPADLSGVAGTVKVLPQIWSPERENARDIYVYLPPSHDSAERPFPVVYMQDGQNLFDNALAFGAEWQVDENMERLSHLGLEAIVVGIPNLGAERCDEYSPFRDAKHGGGSGDQYLDFVTRTLKPLIDQRFRTDPSRDATGILGSSMGALISLHAFFARSEVFGFAGVMSPALWFAEHGIFAALEKAPFMPGRLYLDVGTGEGEGTVADARRLHQLLLSKGYRPGETMMYVEDDGAEHSEDAWARRVRTALYYLIPPRT